MVTHRDNSPEKSKEHQRLEARSWLVNTTALETEAVLYLQFEAEWSPAAGSQTSTAGGVEFGSRGSAGAAGAINATMANEQIRVARQNIEEAHNEFSA